MPRKHPSRKAPVAFPLPAMILLCLLMVGVFYLAARNCNDTATESASFPKGKYDGATAVISSPNEPSRLLKYRGMDISFNAEKHIPNWVSWELTRDETTGNEPRYNKFMADDKVVGSATPADYKLSGYDRGHMAPAGDMKWDHNAMVETFYMTNIVPQLHELNAGAWRKLEEKCRLWATVDSAIYIVCGPILSDAPIEYIGASKVFVPRRFFKVIASPYANPPRGIGFIMPNARVEGGMQASVVSIDQVEALTGMDFFSALPDDIENAIESQTNFHKWPTSTR